MKKIIIYIIVLLFSSSTLVFAGADKCEYDFDSKENNISAAIDNCLGDSGLVEGGSGGTVFTTQGAKTKIESWINATGQFLAFGAIFAIVFGGLTLTLANGEDEKIKKGKDIIKWGILGFLVVVLAGSLIALLINIIYALPDGI